MQDKKTRQQVIRMIVNSQHVESQEELAIELDKAGFPCGPATLSAPRPMSFKLKNIA